MIKNSAEIREDFMVRRNINVDGNVFEFKASRLPAFPHAVTTQLTVKDSTYGSAMWLDWLDIAHKPENARVLLLVGLFVYPDKDIQAPSARSFSRTGDMIKSIGVYDALMQNRQKTYTSFDIEQMIQGGSLPRPEVVAIDPDRPRLKEFFVQEGFEKNNNDEDYPEAYQVPWVNLVDLVGRGRIPLF